MNDNVCTVYTQSQANCSRMHRTTRQYASGFRRGRTREEAVPVEGTSALNRPPTQKLFTKNSFQFIKAAREGVSLTLPQSSSFDPYLSDHFLASNVK